MMRRDFLAMIVTIVCLMSLPAMAMAAPDVQRGPPRGPAPGPTPVAPVSPCHVRLQRDVTPRVLRAGEAVTVSVDGTWTCDGRSLPPTDLLLAIEDSEALRGASAWALPQPLYSLKLALPKLLDAADRLDARVGLLRYAGAWQTELPVARGDFHRAQVRGAIRKLDLGLMGDPVKFEAVNAATGSLPAGGRQVVLLVDAGQPFAVDYRGPSYRRACAVANATHALAILSLHAAESRYADCATPGIFFASNSPVGEDLPERIDEIIDATLREQPPTGLRYEHPLEASAWTFEPEGVAPEPPDEAGPLRIAWEHRVRGDVEGAFAYRYRLRAAPDLSPGEQRLSAAPGAGLLFDYPEDRITRRLRAERVCVYRTGLRDEDCGGFAAAATATAGAGASGPRTPTATGTGSSPIRASATPTPRLPTATASPLPSATRTSRPQTRTPRLPTATPSPPSIHLPRVLLDREG